MKNLVIFLFITLISLKGNSQEYEWVKTLGNNGYSSSFAIDTFQSNLIHGGFFEDILNLDVDTLQSIGDSDGYLSITNTDGEFIKSINWGGTSFDMTDFVGSTKNSIVFSGQTTSYNYKILNNVYEKESNSQDAFIAKLDDNLSNIEWVINDYNKGSLNYNSSMSISDSLINISGFYGAFETRTYNIDGELLWTNEYPTSNSIRTTMDANSIIAVVDSFNVQNINGTLNGGFFKHKLIKYDLNGNSIVEVDIITYQIPVLSTNFSVNSITTDSLGNVLIVGTFEGTITFDGVDYHAGQNTNVFCAKFDQSLNPEWFNVYGNATMISYNSVIKSSGNHYYISWSEKESSFSNSQNHYISKLEHSGNLVSTFKINSTNTVVGYDISLSDNKLFLCGLINGELEANNDIHSSKGIFDIILLKLDLSNFTSHTEAIQENIVYEVFPNPTTRLININSKQNIGQVSVFSTLGNKIIDFNDINSTNFQINLSGLESGQYYVSIGREKMFLKIIKI